MESQHITEVIAYTIKPDTDIKVMRKMINEMIKDLEGYISHQTLQHITEPATFVDLVVWESAAAAKKAESSFHSHPKFNEVGALYLETKFFSQFKPLA